ncbi:MAG TPA: ComEA family DNA-binding protein [Mycobacteriales bacterium]|nr:ComEA family DNA-binding protein [Mycobacteriales bacterium]
MPRSDPAVAAASRLAGLALTRPIGGWVPPDLPLAAPTDRADEPAAEWVTQPPAVGLPRERPGQAELGYAAAAPGPASVAGRHSVPAPAAGSLPAPAPAAVPVWLAGVVDRLPLSLRGAVVAPSPMALLTLAAVCAACVAVTAYTLLHPKAALPPVSPAPLPLPTAAATPGTVGAEVVVDVGGRVRRPGLVTLPPGARVADAIRAAGGVLRHRDLASVNLAARVTDGQLLVVGGHAAAAAAAGAAGTSATGGAPAPVDLNTATVDQLDTLPGIGPVLAQRIVDWRGAHGGFRRVEDLQEVSGIGASTYADLAPLVTV